jgi:hypothetical protein
VLEAIVYGVAVPGHDGKAGCAALTVDPSIKDRSMWVAELFEHAQRSMPRYAVPVFVRVLTRRRGMHNNKQEKGPLKKDGFDLDKVYGEGKDVEDAKRDGGDVMLWWPEGLGVKGGDAKGWMEFTRRDWELIRGGSEKPEAPRL